jgi:predicted short-subunit dehydrogenase-like oxidoreductase (DUF2520 family)
MKDKTVEIVLVGGGHVAVHLIRLFRSLEGFQIKGIWNRTPGKLDAFRDELPFFSSPGALPPADLTIIAVKDDAIREVSQRLGAREGLTVHTSAVLPYGILTQKRKGVFYPLQSFRKERKIDWKNIPVFVDAGQPRDARWLLNLAGRITAQAYRLDPKQKALLHIAAVFANNFSNLMFHLAHLLTKKENLDFKILLPLIRETVERLDDGAPSAWQTGPAVRGDNETIRAHLEYLEKQNLHNEARIYRLLSDYLMHEFKPYNEK